MGITSSSTSGYTQIMPSPTPENLHQKRVVIVGGGYVGVAIANQLQGKCKLTLIDPRECMHHNIGALRAVVVQGFVDKTFIPYKPRFGESFMRGTVTEIDVKRKNVTVDNGIVVQYDYLIICTGSTGNFPAKIGVDVKDVTKAVIMYNAMREKIEVSKEIVIVGGGPVGVELAGEIATEMVNKKITLIHARPGLVDGPYSERFRKSVLDQLSNKAVNVFVDQRVTNLDEVVKHGCQKCTVKTDKGSLIKADVVFLCTGMKTNTKAYATSLADKMDARTGCLKVNEFLQIEGLKDAFAAGDCSTADDDCKMAFTGNLHANVVVANIQNLLKEKPLQPYKPPGPLIVVPIGRDGGVVQFGSWTIGSLAARMMKSKDLFTFRFWREMGQKVPTST